MAIMRYVKNTETRLLDTDPTNPGLGKSELPISVRVVYHIDIPGANNPAGVSYQVASKDEQWNSEEGRVVPLVPELENKGPANLAWYNKLQTGAAFQHQETFKFSSAYLSNPQRDSELDARMIEVQATLLLHKEVEWGFWGNQDTI